jgi:hypothetical protein
MLKKLIMTIGILAIATTSSEAGQWLPISSDPDTGEYTSWRWYENGYAPFLPKNASNTHEGDENSLPDTSTFPTWPQNEHQYISITQRSSPSEPYPSYLLYSKVYCIGQEIDVSDEDIRYLAIHALAVTINATASNFCQVIMREANFILKRTVGQDPDHPYNTIVINAEVVEGTSVTIPNLHDKFVGFPPFYYQNPDDPNIYTNTNNTWKYDAITTFASNLYKFYSLADVQRYYNNSLDIYNNRPKNSDEAKETWPELTSMPWKLNEDNHIVLTNFFPLKYMPYLTQDRDKGGITDYVEIIVDNTNINDPTDDIDGRTDTDGDGIPDDLDADDDNDGIPDIDDLDPLDPTNPSLDTDDDGTPDGQDDDDDNDGIPDDEDPDPKDPTNPSQPPDNPDTDGDGTPDDEDDDDDNDGIPDEDDPDPKDPTNPSQPPTDPPDTDGDGTPDDDDDDDDNDGIPDEDDPDPKDPTNPSQPPTDPPDTDGDGTPDDIDPDDDNDGIPDPLDPDPLDPTNPSTPDKPDSDGDGVPDEFDPTPNGEDDEPDLPPPPTTDTDGDGIPDSEDDDDDNDGIPDDEDPDPLDPTNPSAEGEDEDEKEQTYGEGANWFPMPELNDSIGKLNDAITIKIGVDIAAAIQDAATNASGATIGKFQIPLKGIWTNSTTQYVEFDLYKYANDEFYSVIRKLLTVIIFITTVIIMLTILRQY